MNPTAPAPAGGPPQSKRRSPWSARSRAARTVRRRCEDLRNRQIRRWVGPREPPRSSHDELLPPGRGLLPGSSEPPRAPQSSRSAIAPEISCSSSKAFVSGDKITGCFDDTLQFNLELRTENKQRLTYGSVFRKGSRGTEAGSWIADEDDLGDRGSEEEDSSSRWGRAH